jgi:hypothetical protein
VERKNNDIGMNFCNKFPVIMNLNRTIKMEFLKSSSSIFDFIFFFQLSVVGIIEFRNSD